jgi:hypothetical protein
MTHCAPRAKQRIHCIWYLTCRCLAETPEGKRRYAGRLAQAAGVLAGLPTHTGGCPPLRHLELTIMQPIVGHVWQPSAACPAASMAGLLGALGQLGSSLTSFALDVEAVNAEHCVPMLGRVLPRLRRLTLNLLPVSPTDAAASTPTLAAVPLPTVFGGGNANGGAAPAAGVQPPAAQGMPPAARQAFAMHELLASLPDLEYLQLGNGSAGLLGLASKLLAQAAASDEAAAAVLGHGTGMDGDGMVEDDSDGSAASQAQGSAVTADQPVLPDAAALALCYAAYSLPRRGPLVVHLRSVSHFVASCVRTLRTVPPVSEHAVTIMAHPLR